ncbi:MAG: hypothetical protein ACLTK0_01015 [Anaerovoracaceae bacterium]
MEILPGQQRIASLQMDFDACVSILNPALTAAANGAVTLTGSLVVTPQLRLRVTRPSLFNLDAREINLPCDDLGQCNSCDPIESNCLSDESACCCGHSTPNRIGDILNMIADDSCECDCRSDSCGCSVTTDASRLLRLSANMQLTRMPMRIKPRLRKCHRQPAGCDCSCSSETQAEANGSSGGSNGSARNSLQQE